MKIRHTHLRVLLIYLSLLTCMPEIWCSLWNEDIFDSGKPLLLHFVDDEMKTGGMDETFLPIQFADTTGQKRREKNAPGSKTLSENANVPKAVQIDKDKAVGQIPIFSEISHTGSRTYNVPIEVYPGMGDFQPKIALTYNAHSGNSILGKGWGISGLQVIYRTGQSIYYDGKTSGVELNGNDQFILDGVRLIKTGASSDAIIYETEFGNIKAKCHLGTGSTVKYFEVFYPDGNKGVFGFTNNEENRFCYPISSLADLYGNEIKYNYTFSNNLYHISAIEYNGASIEFSYGSDRSEPILSYSGGVKFEEKSLLQSIKCCLGTNELRRYTFTYTYQTDSSNSKSNALLSQIGYSCGNESYNPLRFYYGTGNTGYSLTSAETLITSGYSTGDPTKIRVIKGRFDHTSDSDGIIVFPSLNPYQQNNVGFTNNYSGSEKILAYQNLSDDIISPMSELKTGKDFVDILCADLMGQKDEYIVKISNSTKNKRDIVSFEVYTPSLLNILKNVYTRSFDVESAYVYGDGTTVLPPKHFYTGDFDGDGKTEILSVSVGFASLSSRCVIYDLENSRLLHNGHIFPYYIDYFSERYYSPEEAVNYSDKVFVMDYDGDGKTDLCHLTRSGLSIYTFDVSGDLLVPRLVNTQNELNGLYLENKILMCGEFNGDGLMDILVSPSSTELNYLWDMYYSKGNGEFEKRSFSLVGRHGSDKDNFFIQDVDGDGKTDLVFYHAGGIIVSLTRDDVPHKAVSCDWQDMSILVPANLNSLSAYSQLVGLRDGVITRFSYPCNMNMESLLTGMADSNGVIEKNDYILLNDPDAESEYYVKGYGATFPFVNLNEPMPVVARTTTYHDHTLLDQWTYRYENCVYHSQGRGFCGFARTEGYGVQNRSFTRVYDPYSYGVLKSEKNPQCERTFSYDISTQDNRIARVNLTKKTETDPLRGFSSTSSIKYDAYGYPTLEETNHSDNSSETKATVYVHSPTVGDGYSLGLARNIATTTTRSGETYREETDIQSFYKRLPCVIVSRKNGNKVRQESLTYNAKGLPLTHSETEYSSPNPLKTTYTYDSYGRIASLTDPIGRTQKYVYDAKGRVLSIKDFRGETTIFGYDSFGRKASISYPDSTTSEVRHNWDNGTGEGLYIISKTCTGTPDSIFHYDALNRLVLTEGKRFDNSFVKTEKGYDNLGNLVYVSEPYKEESSLGNYLDYDIYGRLTRYEEASGKVTTFTYSQARVTENDGRITTVREYDREGNLLSVSDDSEKVSYTYAADGQLASITAPGNIVTSLEYDKYRRRTGLTDPSLGHISYEYDSAGNISSQTDANGKTTEFSHDAFGRTTEMVYDEISISYKYGPYGDLVSVSSDNGTSLNYKHDTHGNIIEANETGTDGVWLTKSFTYHSGNLSSIVYACQSGKIATEQRLYANGHLSEVLIDGNSSIFKLVSENGFGQPTEIKTGSVSRKYDFTNLGLPSGRKGYTSGKTFQDVAYTFDAKYGNLTSRTDKTRSLTESFSYDSHNRLTAFNGETAVYAGNGNILSKSDAGTYSYGLPSKPYAVTGVVPSVDNFPQSTQQISYTSFSRPATISQDGLAASFTYGPSLGRERTRIVSGDKTVLDRHYLGDCYEIDKSTDFNTERLYLLGDFYSSPVVMVRHAPGQNKTDSLSPGKPVPVDPPITVLGLGDFESGQSSTFKFNANYILRDYLGSITHVVNNKGELSQELSYDAWGRLRNPSSFEIYADEEVPAPMLGRGYTGHEHLTQFGLINMNARLYDPVLGRFLSPDPYIQTPDFLQNLNRYSYALNNPLCYIDEDGEVVWAIIGTAALIGGVVNVANHWDAISSAGGWNGLWKGMGYFAIGAGAGGIGAAVGLGATFGVGSMLGVTTASLTTATTGFIPGFISGAANGFAEGLLLRTSNSLMEGESFGNSLVNGLKGAAVDAAFGGLTGGVTSGVKAHNQNLNVLDGSQKKVYTGYFGFNEKGNVKYVGITGRKFKVREAEHLRSNTPRAELEYYPQITFNTRLEARIWEQTQINLYRMEKHGGQLINKFNSIAPKYWNKYGIKP